MKRQDTTLAHLQYTQRAKMEKIIVATLNINGVTSRVRKKMLENFTRFYDIDVFFVQDVITTDLKNI